MEELKTHDQKRTAGKESCAKEPLADQPRDQSERVRETVSSPEDQSIRCWLYCNDPLRPNSGRASTGPSTPVNVYAAYRTMVWQSIPFAGIESEK